MPCVVADTSPPFYLAVLGRLHLLPELYGSVEIPPAVWQEIISGGRAFPAILPSLRAAETDGWLRRRTPTQVLVSPEAAQLDAGGREAIGLATEIGAVLLIIDETLGRRVAQKLGLAVTGTLGVLVEARRRHLLPSLKEELSRLRRETSFRFSIALENEILALAGENANP